MRKKEKKILILGAGVTGLSAGYATGFPIYEAEGVAGGICTSYYVRPGGKERLYQPPKDGNAYHFEIGGGHWIFGGEPAIKEFIKKISPYKTYQRVSSVYLPKEKKFVPYPFQNHLSFLPRPLADKAIKEILNPPKKKARTMKEWNEHSFGKTLSDLFFHPFNELYTAGLYSKIAPQDSYKSPIDRERVLDGYNGKSFSGGYNTTFIYPKKGLDSLARGLANRGQIHYGKKVIKVDLKEKRIIFEDKTSEKFDTLISTLPLNKMAKITGVKAGGKAFPSPSVLVVNIGALKGLNCPSKDQWIYIPKSRTGFHRVGFYSNVDSMFLPKPVRKKNDRVSIYVEKAYPEGTILTPKELERISQAIVNELKEWKWIGEVEACDPTWISTAYTWAWPNSSWKEKTLKTLEKGGVVQVGRYGQWLFQGIADSIKDGLNISSRL